MHIWHWSTWIDILTLRYCYFAKKGGKVENCVACVNDLAGWRQPNSVQIEVSPEGKVDGRFLSWCLPMSLYSCHESLRFSRKTILLLLRCYYYCNEACIILLFFSQYKPIFIYQPLCEKGRKIFENKAILHFLRTCHIKVQKVITYSVPFFIPSVQKDV